MDGQTPQGGPFPDDDGQTSPEPDPSAGAVFGQGRAANALRPGPVLAALTARAVSRVDSLTDDELTDALQAARRLANLADYQQTVLIAKYARRRMAEFEAAKARGVPVGCRDGEFPGEELAMELVETGPYTGARIETATELTTRLPRTLAGMADGLIDLGRAMTIATRTLVLTDADAARADEILAAAAPDLRPDQLARKAMALEMKLAPEAVRARKETAKRLGQRVEARREGSGNASLAGRELDTADVIASKAYLDAIAVRLRNSGVVDGPLDRLRALALTDLTQGRNPLDRINPQPVPAPGHPQPADSPAEPSAGPSDGTAEPDATSRPDAGPTGTGQTDTGQTGTGRAGTGRAGTGQPSTPVPPGDPIVAPSAVPPGYAGPDGWPGWDDDEAANARYHDDLADELDDSPRRGPARPGDPVPLPALINLLVPAGTLLGWGTAPATAAGWGLLDADETRALVRAASHHPRTRWCMTIVAPDGTALAHGCARGQRPWPPDTPAPPGNSPSSRHPQPQPDSQPRHGPGNRGRRRSRHGLDDPGRSGSPAPPQAAQLLDLQRRLNNTQEPIARPTCDHRHAENRYVPSRKLRHLLRARTQTCTAPACNAQALFCDIDHTIPYPDGPTDECNTNPKCRRHHRVKQAPGWQVTQPTPDTAVWTTPSGRTHITSPTVYDL
jgi:hypothetical protein